VNKFTASLNECESSGLKGKKGGKGFRGSDNFSLSKKGLRKQAKTPREKKR